MPVSAGNAIRKWIQSYVVSYPSSFPLSLTYIIKNFEIKYSNLILN